MGLAALDKDRVVPLYYLPILFVLAGASLLAVGWAVQRSVQDALDVDKSISLLPSSWAELKATSASIRHVADVHPIPMLLLFVSAYLFKQTFSFPGSAALNAFAGVAFGGFWGVVVAVICTAFGTIGAYKLSEWFGRSLIKRFKGEERLLGLKARCDDARAKGTLGFYLTALRVAPVFPQWLLNLAAPHIGIGIPIFVFTTAIGFIPIIGITARAGSLISEMELEDVLSVRTGLVLFGLAILIMIPAFVLRRYEASRGVSA